MSSKKNAIQMRCGRKSRSSLSDTSSSFNPQIARKGEPKVVPCHGSWRYLDRGSDSRCLPFRKARRGAVEFCGGGSLQLELDSSDQYIPSFTVTHLPKANLCLPLLVYFWSCNLFLSFGQLRQGEHRRSHSPNCHSPSSHLWEKY